jgi:hypothetical protein
MVEQSNPLRGTRFHSIGTRARGLYEGNQSAVSGFGSRFCFPRGRHGNSVDENLQRDRNINPHCVNRNKLIGT